MGDAEVERCVRAATAVAREHGLEVGTAVRLRESSNVLLHLRPFPVVARVMTATSALHDDPAAWLTREVAVGAHLRRLGAPATAPTDLLPPGPHVEDGLWITFWALVTETPRPGPPGTSSTIAVGSKADVPEPEPPTVPDPARLGASLRALHDALASYDGPELPALSAIVADIDVLLAGLRPAPWFDAEQIADARRELERAAPLLDAEADARPIHGDASISNVLQTPDGLVWNDFEDACRGPVEWDVAGLLLDLRDRAGRASAGGATGEAPTDDAPAAARFLQAYGGHRRDLVEALQSVHRLYAVAWHASRAATHPRARRRLDEHLAARARDRAV